MYDAVRLSAYDSYQYWQLRQTQKADPIIKQTRNSMGDIISA